MRQSDTYDRVPCVSKSSRHNKSPAAVVVGGGAQITDGTGKLH